jgi:osmoprotectant transport system ATP-binding protein
VPTIEVKNLYKHYLENQPILKNINFSIEKGSFVSLVGESGCGKTTMLKMINKLILPTQGEIYVEGKEISEWNTIELRRQIGYVIQQIGLFPHMNIEKNIAYVPSIMKTPKESNKLKVKELIRLVGLDEDVLLRYPRELSGGQSQRVGVARALAADPEIILMDEPFGAVDEITRRRLQEELKKIHRILGKTILFVTHDIEEALKLSDQIIVFNQGVIEQIGTPKEVVFEPKSDYVKSFFGVKGLKASLDEIRLEILYEKILKGEKSIDDLC